MQQIYRRTHMPNCNFNKVAKQLYWNRTSAWVFSSKYVAYFQNIFLFSEHFWVAASVLCNFACNFSMTKSYHYQQFVSSWMFLVVRIVWVDNCLSAFDHFVKLALKGSKSETRYDLETYYLMFPLMSMQYQQ